MFPPAPRLAGSTAARAPLRLAPAARRISRTSTTRRSRPPSNACRRTGIYRFPEPHRALAHQPARHQGAQATARAEDQRLRRPSGPNDAAAAFTAFAARLCANLELSLKPQREIIRLLRDHLSTRADHCNDGVEAGPDPRRRRGKLAPARCSVRREPKALPSGETVALRPALLKVAGAALYLSCSASLLDH